MALGLLLLGAAGGLSARNRAEDVAAGASSARALAMVDAIIESAAVREENSCAGGDPGMPRVQIDGMDYVGRLRIPTLALELPILSQWDDDRLKIAPCRYAGSVLGEDLVIMAHNYPKHFGGLKDMKSGDKVTFTDMEGETLEYYFVEDSKDKQIVSEKARCRKENIIYEDGKYGRLNLISRLSKEKQYESMLHYRKEEQVAEEIFVTY